MRSWIIYAAGVFLLFMELMGTEIIPLEKKYDNCFSVFSIWFEKYHPPINDNSASHIIINMNQANPRVFYNVILKYDFQKKQFSSNIEQNSVPEFSISYFHSGNNNLLCRIDGIKGCAQIASLDVTEGYGENQSEYNIDVTVTEKVISEDARFFQNVTYRTVAKLSFPDKQMSYTKWIKRENTDRKIDDSHDK